MAGLTPRHVGFSLGKLNTFNDGLGEFSRQLGEGLAQRAAWLRETHHVTLTCHVPRAWHGCFGDALRYADTSDWQRWWHRPRRVYDVWHSLHQFNAYRAPGNARWVIQTLHDLNFFYLKTPAKAQRYARRTAALLNRAQSVVTISRYVQADIRARLKVNPPVSVIYNGADDLHGLPQSPLPGVTAPFFLHLSRLAPSKNIDVLLNLAAAWPESRWVLAGADSPYAAAVRERLQAQGLAHVQLHVDLTPEQKAWAYAHCQAFVFPSLAEGFGLPPIEAMQWGRPVFLSRFTCLPEIGGEDAFYFEDYTPSAMRTTMQAGLSRFEADPSRAERVRAHAQTFNWSRTVDEYVALYLNALRRVPPL